MKLIHRTKILLSVLQELGGQLSDARMQQLLFFISVPTQWPPVIPKKGQLVMVAGYPGTLREVNSSLNMIWAGGWATLFQITEVNEGYFVCQIEQQDIVSFPATGSVVEHYLDARGISGDIPSALRLLPHHLHKNTRTCWPVMLAAVTDNAGRLQALHRTYLSIDGKNKASVEPAKMTLGTVLGYNRLAFY